MRYLDANENRVLTVEDFYDGQWTVSFEAPASWEPSWFRMQEEEIRELLDCGSWEPLEHWHVQCFIAGCLPDYDSGAYDTLDAARSGLQDWLEHGAEYDQTYYADDPEAEPYRDDAGDLPETWPYVPAGVDRYEHYLRPEIVKIESCREPDCRHDMY